MKKIFLITLVPQLIVLLSLAQNNSIDSERNLILDYRNVTEIEITNNCYPTDSCEIITHSLDDNLIEELIGNLNNASSTGQCKFYVLYWLDIHFKDGTKRTFRINGQSIKEENDWCFTIDSPDFAGKLGTNWKPKEKN